MGRAETFQMDGEYPLTRKQKAAGETTGTKLISDRAYALALEAGCVPDKYRLQGRGGWDESDPDTQY